MENLDIARNKLINHGFTCVLVKEKEVLMASFDKGIYPLFTALMKNPEIIKGAVLADKIVGKAAALLAVYAGITQVYAHVISDNAKTVLEEKNVIVTYNRIVPYIINQDGTNMCPMELLLADVDDPADAFYIISEKITKNSDC